MQILATGTGDIHEYEGYRAMMIRNNNYHNSTDCITIDGYHPEHRDLAFKFRTYPPRKVYMHLRDIDGAYKIVETNESQRIGKYFTIVDRNKRRDAELVTHEIMKALVHCIRDIVDPDAQMNFQQYPSLRTKLSLGGYTLEVEALDKDICDSSTLTKSFSKQTYFDMNLNFGTNKSENTFLSLPTIMTANPWKQTQPENQLALFGNSHHPGDDQSLVSMTDNSLATTLASIQTELACVVTTMMAVNEQERTKERQVYKDRRKKERKSRKEAEVVRDAQRKLDNEELAGERRDGLKQLEKLEDQRESNDLLILEMVQYMCRRTTTQPTQPTTHQATLPVPVPPPPPQPTLGASQTTINGMVAFLNEIKLNDDVTTATKKSKQHHDMDYKADHSKLTTPPQVVNTNENPSQQPLAGGQQ